METEPRRSIFSSIRKRKGFTLLYAIIMTAIILFIASYSFTYLIRQVRYSTLANDSEDAYYAAQSAGECILHYAQAGIFDKGVATNLYCDGNATTPPSSTNAAIQTFTITITNPVTGNVAGATVTVDTTTHTIEVQGFNSQDTSLPSRVQRAITFRYNVYCPIGGDIMLVIDNSGSIDDSEMAVYKASLKYMIDQLYAKDVDHNTQVGLIRYGTNARVFEDLQLLTPAYRDELKGQVDAMSNMGLTHTATALRNAYLEFKNLKDTVFNWPPSGVLNSDGVQIAGSFIGEALGDNEITTITPAVNRDDNQYTNHVILFTDGGPNDWIATSTVVVNGVTKPKGFAITSPCYWNANGSIYADNVAGVGCDKHPGVYKIPTMYSFLVEAARLKAIATVYTVAIGLAVDPDGQGTALCLPGVTCLDILKDGATADSLSWIANTFDQGRIDDITDEILSCSIQVNGPNDAPTISQGSPSGTLPAGTTSTVLSVTTDKPALCKWNKTTDPGTYSAMSGSFGDVSAQKSHSTTITGLTNGNSYTYYARCQDSNQVESNAYPVTFSIASTVDTQAPSVPTNVTVASISTSQLNVSWSASTDNVGVANYQIQRCTTSGCTSATTIGSPASNSFNDTGLSAGTTYYYRVNAKDATGNTSAYSTVVSGTTSAGSGIPTSGLVGYWKFDTAGTSQIDSSGNGNTGTFVGNATITTADKKVGTGAATFDGTGDYMTVADSPELRVGPGDWAISFWQKTSGTADQDILNKGAGGSVPREYEISDSVTNHQLYIESKTGGVTETALSAANSYVNATWHHVVIMMDQSANMQPYFYVDGVQKTVSSDGMTTTPTATTDTLFIGTRSASTRFFNGLIDELRIYNRLLTPSEISALFAEASGGGGDTTAPTAPTNLAVTGDSTTQVNLSWTASTDNVGVTSYEVQRCSGASCTPAGTAVGTPTGVTFSNTGLTAGTTYGYRVRALDSSTNASSYSSIVYGTTIPTSGLISLWSFDGNAADSVGSNNGTLVSGAAVGSSHYVIGTQALSLVAANSYVNTTNITQMNNASAITVSGWFRDPNPSAAAPYRYLFGKYVSGFNDFSLAVGAGNMNVDIGNGSADTFGSWTGYGSTISANTWYSLVLVYDGTQAAANRITLYVAGTARTLNLTGTIPATTQGLATTFKIGARDASNNFFDDGYVDQLRVYNRALSPAEITAIIREIH